MSSHTKSLNANSGFRPVGLLGFFILCNLWARVDAKLKFRLPLVVNDFSPTVTENEMATLNSVHHRYVVVRDTQLTTKLCVESDSLRLRLLDLPVSSRTLEQYIEKMCPGMDAGWRERAEDDLLASEDFDYDTYFNVATEKVVDVVESTASFTGSMTKEVVHDVLDKTELVMSTASEVIVGVSGLVKHGVVTGAETLDLGTNVLLELKSQTLDLAIDAGEIASDLPKIVAQEVISVKETVKDKLVKPSEIISKVGDRLPERKDVVALIRNVETTLVEDAGATFNAIVDQTNKTVGNYFDKLKEKDSVYTLGDWVLGGLLKQGDQVLTATAVGVKRISEEMPNWTNAFGKALGNIPKGFVDGTNILEETSPIATTRKVVFGERETQSEKEDRYRREKEILNVPYLSWYVGYLETPPETWQEAFLLMASVSLFSMFSFAVMRRTFWLGWARTTT